MNAFWHDLRYGIRLMFKNPGFTLVAVLSLALGVGANTAIFSVANTLMLKPLPGIKNPDGLVWVFSTMRGGSKVISTSYPNYTDYKQQNDVFSGLAAFSGLPLSLKAGDTPEVLAGQIVSGNYFDVLGVVPSAGRAFLPEEDQKGAPAVAVISHGLWKRRFGSNPNVVGQYVTINGLDFNIIGVAPEGFTGVEVGSTPDIWVPLSLQTQLALPAEGNLPKSQQDSLTDRGFSWLNMIGRLKPGTNLQQAEAQIKTIASRLEQEHRDANKDIGAAVYSANSGLDPRESQEMLPIAAILLAIMGLVLLIVCTNLANLLLARSSLRQREIGIRMALGAGRGLLIRQLLTESLVIALTGGALGLALGFWTSHLILAYASVPIAPQIDLRILVFTLIVSLFTVLAFGLVPALQSSRTDLVAVIKDEAATAGKGYKKSRVRNLLIIAQVTLSLILLICAGFFLRSVSKAQNVDLGFDANNVLLVPVDLGLQSYSEPKGKAFYQTLVDNLQTLPNVQSVSLAEHIPLDQSSFSQANVTLEGHEDIPVTDDTYLAAMNTVGLNYFQTLGLTFLRGRDFNAQDSSSAPGVIVVNETLAKRFWPNEDPIGKRLKIGESKTYQTVIGVVKNGTYRNVGENPRPYIYQPVSQNYVQKMTVMIRTAGDPNQIVTSVRDRIHTLDINMPLTDIKLLSEHVRQSFLPLQMTAYLLGGFGLLALVLAAIGVYGVTAYSVSQRTHEVGIRMALGAKPRDVLRLVIGEGMMIVFIGIVIGLLLGFGLTTLLARLVYGANGSDLLVLLLIPMTLALVAFLACYLPARRAARVDPMVALRYQ